MRRLYTSNDVYDTTVNPETGQVFSSFNKHPSIIHDNNLMVNIDNEWI